MFMGHREKKPLKGNFKKALKTKTNVFYRQIEHALDDWENN